MAATAAKAKKAGRTAKTAKPAKTARSGINRSARAERAPATRKAPKTAKPLPVDEPELEDLADDEGDDASTDQVEEQELDQLESDVHSISAREPLRSRLAGDVEAFLAEGGAIVEVPRDFRADPPKRPQSTYGRGSI